MRYRANFFYILVPVIQVAFYFITYELTNYLAHRMGVVYSRGVAWGISADGYAIKYTIIIIALTFLNYFLEKRVLLISIIASVIFGIIVFPVLDSYPYHGGLVILIGVLGIFINYLLLLKYKSTQPS